MPKTNSPKVTVKPRTRDELEAEYLRALFRRDARIWKERTSRGDRLVSDDEALKAVAAAPGTRPHVRKMKHVSQRRVA